ncbi:MAG: hypothetical protein VCE75_28245, partial [Alphaproteobacteria bacterium]
MLVLATMFSVGGCANIDAPAAGCEWVRPIILADDDRLTTATMPALLAHNEPAQISAKNKGNHWGNHCEPSTG